MILLFSMGIWIGTSKYQYACNSLFCSVVLLYIDSLSKMVLFQYRVIKELIHAKGTKGTEFLKIYLLLKAVHFHMLCRKLY